LVFDHERIPTRVLEYERRDEGLDLGDSVSQIGIGHD
jgi:hypothetical protein